MGKKSKKREVSASYGEAADKKEVSGGPEQSDAPESGTSTVTQSKQKNAKNKKLIQDNDNLNTDCAPDKHPNKITEGPSKKRKKHGLVEETPVGVTPSCPADECEHNSSPPAKQEQAERTNKSEVVKANRDFEVPSNSHTTAKGSSQKNRKIIFDDDAPVEVTSSTSKSNKKKQNFNIEEEEVKDEDIDQFCEDIPEEENAQFNDWVKLIEAKLGSNKK